MFPFAASSGPGPAAILYEIAATLTALGHFTFLLFIVFGAWLGGRSRRWKYLHIACMGYGVLIEVFYWVCPLTYLEQALWRKAGRGSYDESFVPYYLNKLIYLEAPQWSLILAAVAVLAVNLLLYARWSRRPAAC